LAPGNKGTLAYCLAWIAPRARKPDGPAQRPQARRRSPPWARIVAGAWSARPSRHTHHRR